MDIGSEVFLGNNLHHLEHKQGRENEEFVVTDHVVEPFGPAYGSGKEVVTTRCVVAYQDKRSLLLGRFCLINESRLDRDVENLDDQHQDGIKNSIRLFLLSEQELF